MRREVKEGGPLCDRLFHSNNISNNIPNNILNSINLRKEKTVTCRPPSPLVDVNMPTPISAPSHAAESVRYFRFAVKGPDELTSGRKRLSAPLCVPRVVHTQTPLENKPSQEHPHKHGDSILKLHKTLSRNVENREECVSCGTHTHTHTHIHK
eukprot:GHVR01191947.1.p1 GENE.GHVR01191947.1~~GHVR01191947.1.p1  ORF type:complete len:153 (+),score=46.96 GHVR01191947.1:90-548(+)